ncbi:MAG: 4'-phosphopantetheinyl transferase superfamily protein [Bacteroidetes bacterium]|nr:4'-phosphopantetheinyl transferase superfamily protein [Bacteroidota bacterium]
MPFFREINPAEGIRAGIWHITETSAELLAQTMLNNSENAMYERFRHELRKRQWLACRLMLKHLLAPQETQITYNLHGKPFLESGSHQISISHAGDFAAVAFSETMAVGIDIEKMKERIERVKERFLQKNELESLSTDKRLEQLYILWGGKEALYKLHGKQDIDFRNDIYIHPFDYLCHTIQYCDATLTVNGSPEEHILYFQTIEDYMVVVAY